jgi:hypothetical protein
MSGVLPKECDVTRLAIFAELQRLALERASRLAEAVATWAATGGTMAGEMLAFILATVG